MATTYVRRFYSKNTYTTQVRGQGKFATDKPQAQSVEARVYQL